MIFSTTALSATLAVATIVALLVICNAITWLLAMRMERVGDVIESLNDDEFSKDDMRFMISLYKSAAEGLTKYVLLYGVMSLMSSIFRRSQSDDDFENILTSLTEDRKREFFNALLKMMLWRDPVLFVSTILVVTLRQLVLFLFKRSAGATDVGFGAYNLWLEVYRSEGRRIEIVRH